ncbi:MAG: hypothetical protein R2746_02155 [Acidimicrobiales bacterium]
MHDRTPDDEPVARAIWRRFEPIHAVTYFAPSARSGTRRSG